MTKLRILLFCSLLAGTAAAQVDDVELREAVENKDYSKIIELTNDIKPEAPNPRVARDPTNVGPTLLSLRATSLQERGQNYFFAGKIAESIKDFDAYLKLFPTRDPHHWQRGISYYYADNYAAGKAQFERHQNVNTQDVENAVWHFLCAVRVKGGSVEKARENLISINRDTRVPMKQIHELFSGKASADEVLAACESKNENCYAHLYLGLYYEAIGDKEKAKLHMERAANEFRMDHYMGKVAQVHAKLRGWKSPLE